MQAQKGPVNKFSFAQDLLAFITNATLFAATFYFIFHILQEFMEENTAFSVSKRPISSDDFPTATICLFGKRKFSYGEDFIIQTLQASSFNPIDMKSSLINLSVGVNEYELLGKRLILLKELTVLQASVHTNKSCVALNLHLKDQFYLNTDGNTTHTLGLFTISLLDNTQIEDIHQVVLRLTTEPNSYGDVHYKWFDGKTHPYELTSGRLETLKIHKITQYEYLKDKCHEGSFYGCIGSKVDDLNCEQNGLPCTPFSIPQNLPPQCQRNMSNIKECEADFNSTIFLLMDQCKNKQPCHVKEYDFDEVSSWTGSNSDSSKIMFESFLSGGVVQNLMNQIEKKYTFMLMFLNPEWSREKYQYGLELKIENHKEYRAMTGISLVAGIGGHLGLFMGFSIAGFVTVVKNIMTKLCDSVQK